MTHQFTLYTPANAPDMAKPLLEKIQSAYGFIPNLFAYMAEAPRVIDAYLQLSESIAKSSLTPANVQLICWITSIENQCDFCSTAHNAIAGAYGVKQQTIDALLHEKTIEDREDFALVNFTKALVSKRGQLADSDTAAFLNAGFTRQQIVEIVMVVASKILTNYIGHMTRPEINPEILALL